MPLKLLLCGNYKKLAFLSAFSFYFSSCGKSNQAGLITENKNISNYHSDHKYVDHINIDPFGVKFLNDLEAAVIDKDFENVNKIKEVINKLRDPSSVSDNEGKYKGLVELAKVLPTPFMIDEKNLYNNKYNYIAEQIKVYYEKTAKPVPKEVHFIWLGGPLGEIQKEYVKVWAKLNPDYNINIWYDSDHLYTYEANKKLREFLNYTLAGVKNDPNFKKIFTEKYINLQNDMFLKMMKNHNVKSLNFSFDKERINYIEKILYNKGNVSYEAIDNNLNIMLNDAKNLSDEYENIKVKDFKVNKFYWQLKNTYEQEMLLRGNFAAAGDSARLEILARFGGLYMDIDVLPSIKQLNLFMETHKDGPYSKYIPQRFRELSLLFFEQIFNHHKELLPSRKISNKYRTRFITNINHDNTLTPELKSLLKTAIQSTLTKIKDIKDINEVFNKLDDINIRTGEFKAAEDTNNFIAAHQVKTNNDWVHILRDKITDNYKKLNKIEKNNPDFYYEYDKNYILTTDKTNYVDPKRESKSFFNYSIHDYRKDSIADTRITIFTSGPGVLTSLYEDLFPEFMSQRGYFYKNVIVKNTTEFSLKNKVFNNATEEDVNSSWASKTAYHDGERFGSRNVIMSVGQEDNIKNASEYILSKKQVEKIPASLIDIDNLFIANKNSDDYEKINLYIVGHAEISENSIKIGDLTAEDLATKISEFTEKNKNQVIDYIDIISCNPTNNPNDTANIETFSKSLIENLHNLGVSLDIITVRKNIIKIDNNGNELVRSKYGIYNFSNDADKIYIVRKGRNDYISITTDNIIAQIQPENIKNLNKFNTAIRNILSKKSEALGDFSATIDKIKIAYNNLKSSRNNSIDSEKISYNYSSSKIQNFSDTTKQVAKYTFKGLDKFTSITNKYNIFMNLLNTPKSLSNISSTFANHMYLEGGRETADFAINNADLVLDLVKSYKGASYWQQHAQAFQNINKTQIGLNLVSAGLDVWRAYDLYRNAYVTEEQARKIDSIVNASFTTARAASSIGTAIFLPLTAKAGPVGAAIGYTIMFSQGTYNAVRTSQELRKLGFKEEEITLKSILKFFGQYEETDDPSYVTKIEANKLNNSIIPNILNEKNKEYFAAMERGKGEESKLFYFKKIIYPKIDLYIPYTTETIITGCYYGICVPSKSGGKRIEKESHSCLTNNSFFAAQSPKNNELTNLHFNSIQMYSELLENKKAERLQAPNGQYYSQAIIQHNNTIPCPSAATNTPMIVKTHEANVNDVQKIGNIPEYKKANLYLLGFGDQGKHGNMIHSISAEMNDINLFNIHPATYMLHVYGGNKEDIFEFYDTVHSKNKNKGFIDGGQGIDTVNILGIKDKKITISLDMTKPSDFPELRNIENIFATDEDDIVYGNSNENFLVGNGGNDEIYGNDGDDTLVPSYGFDKLNGGSGRDTYYILLKDLKNNDTEKITNNLNVITSEIKEIKKEIELFKQKLTEININVDLVYNKIQTYNSYMFEIKDIYSKTSNLFIELKESGIKVLKRSYTIKKIAEEMANSVNYYDGKKLNFANEMESIKRFSSYISHFENSIKNNLIYAENFLKQANEFQIANEGYDARIHQFTSSSFGFDNQSQFNRSMAMQTRSVKEAYISSQVINFNSTKSNTILNLSTISNNSISFLLKLQDISYQLQIINNKMKPIYHGVKTIDNYDDLFNNEEKNGVDLIKTDIKNLVSQKSLNNLILGFYQDNDFIQAIIIKDYFLSEKYQHILVSDLSGNIYSTLNGSLYSEDLIENSLNTIKINNGTSDIYLDNIESSLLDTKKNIVATLGNDTIHGNSQDNFIFGNGGYDKIDGHNGNDTISIVMNSNLKMRNSDESLIELFKSYFGSQSVTEITGGNGNDNYILNFSKSDGIESEFKVVINNEDNDKNLDNLIINDLQSDITSFYFLKEKNDFDSNFSLKVIFKDKDKKEYIVIIKNWFLSEMYRHLQIQIGNQLNLSQNILEEITKSLESNSSNYMIKIYTDKSFNYYIYSYENSFHYINAENSRNLLEEIHFRSEENIINNLLLKISKIDNEIVFKLINKSDLSKSSFVLIRDEISNIKKLKNLKIKVNNNIFLENEKLISFISNINNGEIIDVALE